MVSRLLSSLSGMLLNTTATDKDNSDDTNNDNGTGTPPVNNGKSKVRQSKSKGSRSTKSDADRRGIESLNAESLDRAIAHRLRSSMNTSRHSSYEADVDVETATSSDLRNADSGLKLRRSSIDDLEFKISATDTNKTYGQGRDRFPGTHFSPSSSRAPLTRSEEKRNVVYRNTQFNLENTSKEALAPENTPYPNMESLSKTLLNLPIFGIPDPSLYRRPSPTSSTESVRGTEVSVSNASTLPKTKKLSQKNRTRSPSLGSKINQSLGFNGRLSTSTIGEDLFEETMTEILDAGGEDFKNKYASWVWDVFRTHLAKLKSHLLAEFNQRMKETLDEREKEVLSLQQQYREKLSEFDVTTNSFQSMIDNLYQENQRVLKAKDFVIEKLKKEFLECKRHFEMDLLRQLQSFRKEAEVEKIELQKRNDELMRIMMTDGSKSGIEDALKREVESLHKMIKALTTQNEILTQQLDGTNFSSSTSNQNTSDKVQSQLESAKIEMSEMRKKIQANSREKEDLTVSHHQEIAKLNRKLQEANTRYDHRIRETSTEMEHLRKKHVKDTKALKQQLANKEVHQGQVLAHLKSQYGGQVETLSKAVSQLQAELTGTVSIPTSGMPGKF